MDQVECYPPVVMDQLLLDVSLWSADLANLESEIRRLEPFADSFHFDAADGHFSPVLLFFPDLVARLRALTRVEFHIHLMATRPMDLLGAFLDAGADRITLPYEAGKRVHPALEYVKQHGKKAGLSVALDTPLEAIRWMLPLLDTVVVMGTEAGVKGLGADERVFDRLTAVKKMAGDRICVTADGGIREETVPLMRAAGADAIVPGSLVCQAADLAATAKWLKSL